MFFFLLSIVLGKMEYFNVELSREYGKCRIYLYKKATWSWFKNDGTEVGGCTPTVIEKNIAKLVQPKVKEANMLWMNATIDVSHKTDYIPEIYYIPEILPEAYIDDKGDGKGILCYKYSQLDSKKYLLTFTVRAKVNGQEKPECPQAADFPTTEQLKEDFGDDIFQYKKQPLFE